MSLLAKFSKSLSHRREVSIAYEMEYIGLLLAHALVCSCVHCGTLLLLLEAHGLQ